MDNQPMQPVVSQPSQPEPSSINQTQPTINKPARSFKLPFLSLVIIILVAGGGYGIYTWQHKKVSDSNAKAASLQSQVTGLNKQVAKLQNTLSKITPATTNSTTKSSPSTNATQTNYFTISQWGIRATYNGSLTLKYVVDQYDINDVSLSSAQMEAAGSPNNGGVNVCGYTDNGEAGHIGRYLPTDTNLTIDASASETAQQYIEQNSSIPHAVIGNYIYIYWSYLKNGTYSGPCDTALTQQTMNAYAALMPQLTSY